MAKYEVGDKVKVDQYFLEFLGMFQSCSLERIMKIPYITVIEINEDGEYRAKENNYFYPEETLCGILEEDNKVENIYKYENANGEEKEIDFDEVENIDFNNESDNDLCVVIIQSIYCEIEYQIIFNDVKEDIEKAFNNYKKSLEFEVWKPKVGEVYWLINNWGKPEATTNDGSRYDNYMIKSNSFYQAEEEAEKEAKRQVAEANVVRYIQKANKGVKVDFKNENKEKFYLFNSFSKMVITNTSTCQTLPSEFYFVEVEEIKKAKKDKEFIKDYKIMMGWE